MKTAFLVLFVLISTMSATTTSATSAVQKQVTSAVMRRPLGQRGASDKVHSVAVATSAQSVARSSSPTDFRADHRHSARRLFRIMDLISFLTGKKEDEVMEEAKAKLEQKMAEDINKHGTSGHHRRLPPYELGTAFHVLRFFSNRVAEINDKAFAKMEEEEAARLTALGSTSSSSSSSMDAEAREAAKIEASRAKAAAAYGLTTPSVSPTVNMTEPTTRPPAALPSPSPTVISLLTSIEW